MIISINTSEQDKEMYELSIFGSDCDGLGNAKIASEELCKNASTSLGLHFEEVTDDFQLPQGCIERINPSSGRSMVYWNSQSSQNQRNSVTRCICEGGKTTKPFKLKRSK